MSLPRIAIVGRPNVGKSSLMNLLARAKVSIVDPTPGVTRDRVAAVVALPDASREEGERLIELIDTGGFGVYTAEGERFDDIGEDLNTLREPIEEQIAEAVRLADLILFVVDAQTGVTPLDEMVAQLLRESVQRHIAEASIRVLIVANKVDGDNWEAHGMEASSLGFGEPTLISAATGFRRRAFIERVLEELPAEGGRAAETDAPEMKIAIVGKRNAGKSSLVNALAGEERMIVSEIAGTTRDAVDVRFEVDGHAFVAIDTAGFRRRRSMSNQIEWYATHRALRSVRRADVVLLLIDATERISHVDKQLGKEIQDNFKPCLIVVNKWDLAAGRLGRKGKPVTIDDYGDYLGKELKGLSRCPVVFTSAKTGEGVRDAIDLARELHEQSVQRLSTSKLNTILREILESRGPTSKLGTQAKILYTTQVSIAPPTIVLVVNHEALFTPAYRRYLLNRLAEATPFTEIPIRLIIRDRKRARLEDLLAGDRDRGESTAEPPPRPSMPRVVHGLADELVDDEDDAEIERMLKRIETEGGEKPRSKSR